MEVVDFGGSLLALDPGTRRIGLAGADSSFTLATPLAVIRRERWFRTLPVIETYIQSRQAAGLVVGWPLNSEGEEGPRAIASRDIADNLARDTGLPVLLLDESLTSFEAQDRLWAGRKKPGKNQPIDHIAAACLLQTVLDQWPRKSSRTRGTPS